MVSNLNGTYREKTPFSVFAQILDRATKWEMMAHYINLKQGVVSRRDWPSSSLELINLKLLRIPQVPNLKVQFVVLQEALKINKMLQFYELLMCFIELRALAKMTLHLIWPWCVRALKLRTTECSQSFCDVFLRTGWVLEVKFNLRHKWKASPAEPVLLLGSTYSSSMRLDGLFRIWAHWDIRMSQIQSPAPYLHLHPQQWRQTLKRGAWF